MSAVFVTCWSLSHSHGSAIDKHPGDWGSQAWLIFRWSIHWKWREVWKSGLKRLLLVISVDSRGSLSPMITRGVEKFLSLNVTTIKFEKKMARFSRKFLRKNEFFDNKKIFLNKNLSFFFLEYFNYLKTGGVDCLIYGKIIIEIKNLYQQYISKF